MVASFVAFCSKSGLNWVKRSLFTLHLQHEYGFVADRLETNAESVRPTAQNGETLIAPDCELISLHFSSPTWRSYVRLQNELFSP